MITLFLPGFAGQYNGPEMTDICNFLRDKGMEMHEVHWPHWQDPLQEFVADDEVEKIWQFISTQKETEFNIVAKSIGTYVAMKLLAKYKDFNPKKVILMGIPVSGSLPESEIRLFPESFARVGDGFNIVQNENDPFGSAAQVKELFDSIQYKIDVKEGNDSHAYQMYAEDIYEVLNS